MSKMSFSMGICRKKFIWSKLPVWLFRESLLDWYVVFANPYMVSSSLVGLGLENLAMLFNNLVCEEGPSERTLIGPLTTSMARRME